MRAEAASDSGCRRRACVAVVPRNSKTTTKIDPPRRDTSALVAVARVQALRLIAACPLCSAACANFRPTPPRAPHFPPARTPLPVLTSPFSNPELELRPSSQPRAQPTATTAARALPRYPGLVNCSLQSARRLFTREAGPSPTPPTTSLRWNRPRSPAHANPTRSGRVPINITRAGIPPAERRNTCRDSLRRPSPLLGPRGSQMPSRSVRPPPHRCPNRPVVG